MNNNQCRALIPYRREYFTFEERLLLMHRQNYQIIHDIMWKAAVRSMGIPLRLLHGEASYSSFASNK